MLIAGDNASYGGVAEAPSRTPQALLKSVCWAAVKPSASSTTLNARLRGALPKIWVAILMTAPSEVVMAVLPQRLI